MNRKLKLKIIENFGTAAKFSTVVQEDEPAISRVLHGRKILKPERQQEWARVLKSTPSELFNGEACCR